MKKINKGAVGNFFKGLVREGLQTLPIIGTLVTSFKSETEDSPKGQISLGKWEKYRILIGLVITYNLLPDSWTVILKGLFGF